jgi:hypothetical protein
MKMDAGLNSENSSGEVGNALAALERRDYATAKRLFETLGRKDAAESIESALAALDRKDYATAQGLFEALAPPKPALTASDARTEEQSVPVVTALAAIPPVDPAYRRPAPPKAKRRGSRSGLISTVVLLAAAFGASAIYASRSDWTFVPTKGEAIAGLASTVDLIKARFRAITGQNAREEDRSALRDLGAALTQVTIRLDQIEHDYGARLDKLGERIDQDSSPRLADIAARLDSLEKKTALPSPPAPDFADVVARLNRLERRVAVAATPSSELADIATRLNRLEKKAATPAVSLAKPFSSTAPTQPTLAARAEPSTSNDVVRPDSPRPLLRDYSVEYVQDGVAVVDTRNGPQEVAPGDLIPGAGRVLRIERRGEDWIVLTSLGVIASGSSAH